MRHSALWTLALLGLPGVAVAGDASGVTGEQVVARDAPAIESTGTPPAVPPPALDLRIDPTQLPASGTPSTGPQAVVTGKGNREPGTGGRTSDRGLSFGVEMQPRSQVGRLAREHEADAPGLEDNLQRLIDRGTLGVRGHYRF